jgi:excisionase family DNA binding protein
MVPALNRFRASVCERLITVREVAARLGVSPASVYKLFQCGELHGLRIGAALRFSLQMINEYITRCAPPRPR